MKALKLIALASLVFAITACCACRRNKAQIPFNGTEWKLTQLYGEAVDAQNYRVTFGADGAVSGIGDCNRFSGSFTQNVKELSIADNLVSTRMMCLNQAREDKFFGMLREADSYDIDGTRLMLLKGGDVLAIFDPVVTAAPVEKPAE